MLHLTSFSRRSSRCPTPPRRRARALRQGRLRVAAPGAPLPRHRDLARRRAGRLVREGSPTRTGQEMPRRDLGRRPRRRQAAAADRGAGRQGAPRVGRRLLARRQDDRLPLGRRRARAAPDLARARRRRTAAAAHARQGPARPPPAGRRTAGPSRFSSSRARRRRPARSSPTSPTRASSQETFEEQRIAVADVKTGQVRAGLPRRPLRLRLRLVARRADVRRRGGRRAPGTNNYWVAELYRVDAGVGRDPLDLEAARSRSPARASRPTESPSPSSTAS